jgi:hypothetical protein
MQITTDQNPLFSLKAARYILPMYSDPSLNILGLEVLLRSRLGFLLKARFCPFADFEDKKRDCAHCQLAPACFYPFLFHPDKLPAEMKKDKQPFVVSVFKENISEQPHSMGDYLQLTLFGKAIPYHRPLLESVQQALDYMIGDGNNENPHLQTGSWHTVHPFVQEGKWLQVLEEYNPSGQGNQGAPLADWIASMSHQEEGLAAPQAEVVLLTPLQLDAKKIGPQSVCFEDLIEAIVRRLRDLKRYYGDDTHMGSLPPGFYQLRKRVNQRLEDYFFYDQTLQMYDKAIRLHGVQGLLTLEGPLEPFMSFLKAGEIVGVGRRVSYGLGRIKVL